MIGKEEDVGLRGSRKGRSLLRYSNRERRVKKVGGITYSKILFVFVNNFIINQTK